MKQVDNPESVKGTIDRSRGGAARHWSYLLLANPVYAGIGAFLSRLPRLRMALLVLPPVAWVVVWHVLPLVQIARISVQRRYPSARPEDQVTTFEHYLSVLNDPNIYGPLLKTIGYSLWVAAVSFIMMLPIAYFLARRVSKAWQMRLLILIIMPAWVSEVIRVFSYVLIFASNGLINIILQSLGLAERPVPLLYTWSALSAGALYIGCLFMVVPLYTSIEKIPAHMLEAGADLGASAWQRIHRIVLPMCRDGIATGVTFVFLITAGLYTVPAILAGSDSRLFAQVIGTYFHETNLTWSKGSALSITLFVLALLISAILNWLIRPKQKY